MISLGTNVVTEAEGFSAEGFPKDSFIKRVKGKNLFIYGNDTRLDETVWAGWSSYGTLYGTFDFLERELGVRWLMPGDLGEVIPKRSILSVSTKTVSGIPDFKIRKLDDIQEDRKISQDWLFHQRIPMENRVAILYGHSWGNYNYIPNEALKDEYTCSPFPLLKLCTANPEVIHLFSQGVITWFDEHPINFSTSISPSDGSICDCNDGYEAPASVDPHGHRSVTTRILDFYNSVAKIVGAQFPERQLNGIVYYDYAYPPKEPVEIAPNLGIVWVPLNYYGRGLEKQVYRNEFPEVLSQWRAISPNFYYHNYSTWMRSYNGAPLPPGFNILELEIPELKNQDIDGVMMIGMGSWGVGALNNYILAKQMWNADVNIRDIYEEWLQLAYGPGWEAIDEMYALIESAVSKKKQDEDPEYSGDKYEVNRDFIESIYLPLLPQIEKLYISALSRTETEPQTKRLQMLGDNLFVLYHDMKEAGMLENPEESYFYLPDDRYESFLQEQRSSLSLYSQGNLIYVCPIWEGEWGHNICEYLEVIGE